MRFAILPDTKTSASRGVIPIEVESHSPRQYWVVTCPVSRIENGVEVWRRWYRERIVAVGFPPTKHCEKEPGYSLINDPPSLNWDVNRRCLLDMKVGDKILPFLLERRIGPVGTIRALRVSDGEWSPTVGAGVYEVGEGKARHKCTVCELGRQIDVEWQIQNMPPEGKVVLVNPGEVVSRSTVRPLNEHAFVRYARYLESPRNWVPLYRR